MDLALFLIAVVSGSLKLFALLAGAAFGVAAIAAYALVVLLFALPSARSRI
jgi:hypothetical protein